MEIQTKILWNNMELAATCHFPSKKAVRPVPLVIICHGFIGSKVGVNRLFVKTAENLAQNYAVLRFDYKGCGESSGNYGENELTGLISQTMAAIDYGSSLDGIDPEEIILLGHSLGGAVALLTAVRDSRVKKLILWSAAANPFEDIVNIVGRDQYDRLQEESYVDYLGYPLTSRFFDSLSEFAPLKELRCFSGDVLIVHGTGDAEIPVTYCDRFSKAFESIGCSCVKKEIAGADHTYSSIGHFNELLAVTSGWLGGGK